MGQFEKGNPGGPGGARAGAGRKRKEVAVSAQVLLGGITEEDMAAILGKAVEQAKAGDATARSWLFDRIYGRVVAADVQGALQDLQEHQEQFQEALLDELATASPELREKVLARLEAEDEE